MYFLQTNNDMPFVRTKDVLPGASYTPKGMTYMLQ
jgi:hypothetical protein